MIYAKLTDAPAYRGIHPRLDRALALLTPDFLASVGAETRQLEGEALYVTRFDLQTSPDETRLFEYHRSYLDIFTLLEGEEQVDIAPPEDMTVVEQRNDYWGCTGQAQQHVRLRPGQFLVLFPGDAHRPGVAGAGGPQRISRVVFKIRFKEN